MSERFRALAMAENLDDPALRGENLLKHFTDKELQSELERRQGERRKMEITKIIGSREAIGFYDVAPESDDFIPCREYNAEWELHIIFSDATKHRFTFSSKVGHTVQSRDDFRMLYFPHLSRLSISYYDIMVASKKQRLRKKKNKNKIVCHGP